MEKMPEDNLTEESDQENGSEKNGNQEGKAAEASESLEEQLKKAKAQLLYVAADFENYKKRMSREKEEAIRFGNERFIRELLRVVDYLERALAHTESIRKSADENTKTFLEGIEMTQKELLQMLGRFGVTFVGQVGEAFDPNCHEAIAQREVAGKKLGTIVEVCQKGCLLQGRLLQPAKVIVAAAPVQDNKD